MAKKTAAKVLMVARNGIGYSPPAASGAVFSDVTAGIFNAAYIEALYVDYDVHVCDGSVLSTPIKHCLEDVMTKATFAKRLAGVFGLAP